MEARTEDKIEDKIQTPCYIYDLDVFDRRVRQVKRILGEEIPLTFSIKANPFLTGQVPPEIRHVEVCSPGELEICIRVGQDPSRIIYSGVMKENSDIRRALDYGVDILTAESSKHVRMIEDEAGKKGLSKVKVLLRLSSGNQFGMDRQDIYDIIRCRSNYPHIDFIGLHYYSGTQKEKERVFAKDADRIEEVLDHLKSAFEFEARLVEYGPGTKKEYFLPADFDGSEEEAADFIRAEDEKALELTAKTVRRLAERCPVGVEMGRFLAASCGTYYTRVMDRKTTEGCAYVILDGGIHQVNYYGKLMADMRGRKPLVSLIREGVTGDRQHYCLCGSLCTTADVLVRDIELPALQEGDILAFREVGAYSITEAMELFLSRDMPGVYLARGGKKWQVRQQVASNRLNSAAPE